MSANAGLLSGNLGADAEQRALTKVKRHLLTYIIVSQMFVQIDRVNIGYAQLTMSKELMISATAFGFAAGIFGLAAFFVQVPNALLFEKFGARRWLTMLMLSWGIVVILQAFVTNKYELIGLRFLLGAFESGYVPCLYVLISLWFAGNQHGSAVAGLQLGVAASGVFGGPVAGWLLGQSLFGLTGWRTLFLAEGAVTVAWALLALFLLYDNPGKAPWLSKDERTFMAEHIDRYQRQKAAVGAVEKQGFLHALKDGRIIALIAAASCAGWVAATFAFFIPILLKTAAHGASNQTVGFLAMGPYFVMGLVAYFWSAHADRTRERHWHCVIPLLVALAGVALFSIATGPVTAMLCLAMVQAGSTGFFVNFWPSCDMVVGKQTIAKTTSLIMSGNLLSNFMAPLVFGWLIDLTGGPALGLYVCICVILINFTIMNVFFFTWKRRQSRMAVQ
ncbi:MFS transporter [Novosphingobium flavum]|uniref:MFS transporter n=1 Tax=Novosphingobium flavum TaxID=1778672 RepID=A0A7X1KL94_9SPHN|nr:MFS transporter [Novosphingobium flavum]MBC2665354.1 MFS transporter [Novosphingobium flavum]